MGKTPKNSEICALEVDISTTRNNIFFRFEIFVILNAYKLVVWKLVHTGIAKASLFWNKILKKYIYTELVDYYV